MLKSSLLIILIPLIAGIICIAVLFASVGRSAKMINNAALSSVSVQTDSAFMNVYDATLALSETSQYRRLILSEEPTNEDLYEFQKVLQSHTNYFSLISKTIVFLHNNNVITDSNYRTFGEFLEDDFFLYGMGRERLTEELTKHHNKNLFLRTSDSRGIASPYSLFFQTISVGADQYLCNVVLLVINNAEVKNIMNDVAWNSGHLELVQDNVSIAAVGKSFESRQYVQHSANFSMEYVASGQSMYESEIFSTLIFTLSIMVMLSLIVAVFLSVVITRRNYKPISQIDIATSSQLRKSSVNLTELANKVSEFADRYADIQLRYNEDKESSINQLFLRMLKGQALPESRFAMCHRYGIECQNRRFVVISITSPFLTTYVRALSESESSEISRLVFASSNGIVDELFCDFSQHFLLDYDGSRYVLVVSMDDKLDVAEQLAKIKNLCLEYRDRVNKQYRLNISLAISNPIDSIKELGVAFRQADDAQSFIDLLGSENEVLLYCSIDNAPYSETAKNDERETHLANLIKAKDFEGAKSLFLEILDNDIINAPAPLRPLMLDAVVCKTLKTIMNLSAYTDNTQQFYPLVEDVTAADTALLKRNYCIKLFEELELYYKQNFDRSEEVCKKIMDFVDERYADPNLNVGLIADTFSFSLSYISRFFKKSTGQNILDYIQKRRIDRAKELLKERLSIQEVAERVGYVESRALIRAFKKQEKITPGKYNG